MSIGGQIAVLVQVIEAREVRLKEMRGRRDLLNRAIPQTEHDLEGDKARLEALKVSQVHWDEDGIPK